MGCDIHLYAEAKKRKTFVDWLMFWKRAKWVSIDKWKINEDYINYPNESHLKYEVHRDDRFYSDGRNYNLFCALCGVRSYQFEGVPKIISEPKGVPKDASKEYLQQVKRWDGDGHSHSWNTLKELLDFDWSDYGNTTQRFLDEVIPKMKQAHFNPEKVRIVYFFDN